MAKILLQELSSPGCVHCKEFDAYWHTIEKDWPEVDYQRIDMTTPEGQELIEKYMIFASPGIIINGELHATGGFDKTKFLNKLTKLRNRK